MRRLLYLVKNLLPYAFILVAGYFVVKPLFIHGFYPMHDDAQVARVFEMDKSLSDGFFPVRWVSDLGYGYGYPIFNFYAPLSYYVGAIFMLVGFSALTGTKIMIGLGLITAGICMYLFAKSIFGKFGGIFAAICYLFAPYHALDSYVRGDVAEIYAYAFLPLAAYGLWKTFKTKNTRFAVLSAVGFAGLVLSHNLTAFMLSPFFVICSLVFIFIEKKRTVYQRLLPILSLILGIVITAFYWIPVFFEMRFTNVLSQIGGGSDFRNNFVCISQLWYSPWGYGGSAPNCNSGISFALGKIYIVIILASIVALPLFYKIKKEVGIIVSAALFCLGFSIFMLLQVSEPIWNLISPLSFLQFPWRFLLPAFFFMSILGGGLMFLFKHFVKGKLVLIVALFLACASIIVLEGRYFRPQYIYPATSNDFTSTQVINWKTSKISDEYMPKGFVKPTEQNQVPSQLIVSLSGTYSVETSKAQEKKIQLSLDRTQTIYFNLAYFPAWTATLDSKPVALLQTPMGMKINDVPKGVHTIDIFYKSTLPEEVGNIVSLIGIIISFIAIIV